MENREEQVLTAYLQDTDSGRWTSQDICDNLRDTLDMSPNAVTDYMLKNGWLLWRKDDRLVWVKP